MRAKSSVDNCRSYAPWNLNTPWLKDARIEPCRGYFVCFPHGEDRCPGRDDDVRLIRRKMQGADAVIFASPVYSADVSGLMKTFIDRISYTGHRPVFFGKKSILCRDNRSSGCG